MSINIDQIKSAAAGGDANAMSKLASMHIVGMFPGANPQEGIRLLEILVNPPYERHGEMIELGLHYVKGNHVPESKDKGLALIEKGLAGLGENVPFEHCFEVGMMLAGINDEHGEKVPKWQKLSAKLLEKTLADTQGMAELEMHMGHQVVMVVKGMLNAVKGWISNYEPYAAIMANAEAAPPVAPTAYSGSEAPDYAMQSSMRACPNCFTKINPGEASCSGCMQQTSSPQVNTSSNACSKCGCTFPNHQAQFCEQCGTKRMG